MVWRAFDKLKDKRDVLYKLKQFQIAHKKRSNHGVVKLLSRVLKKDIPFCGYTSHCKKHQAALKWVKTFIVRFWVCSEILQRNKTKSVSVRLEHRRTVNSAPGLCSVKSFLTSVSLHFRRVVVTALTFLNSLLFLFQLRRRNYNNGKCQTFQPIRALFLQRKTAAALMHLRQKPTELVITLIRVAPP